MRKLIVEPTPNATAEDDEDSTEEEKSEVSEEEKSGSLALSGKQETMS